MRSLRMLALLAPLALAACGGGEDRTVVVNPQPAPAAAVIPPGSTIITPPAGNTVTRVCPPGAITC
ncbi:hypothetical protein EDC65_2964 [Stella humosa]|uniref:Lipoprotein n=1 Tax=Stella humosa TaxID=94 RepID=A0A3N1LDE4_9PROT|nr:hypothetical protein [Stella humosa]ROP91101.1 hypothetical protein EDC65_2964 [Stella humosa]BBK34548.1 hypothetical protein STHU_51820 [Stella humosa]